MMLGAALLVAPATANACTLVAGGSTSLDALLTFNGQPAPAPATEAAGVAAQSLMNVEQYKTAVPGCTQADISRELIRLNGWDSTKLVSISDKFILPKAPDMAPAPKQSVEAAAPAAVDAKPAVVVKPSPELRAVRTELATVRRQKAEMAPRLKSVAPLPFAALSSDERAMIQTAAKLDKRIAALEPLEARMTAAEAVNTAQSQHLAAHDKQLLANGQQLNAHGERLTNVEKQAAAAQVAADAALAQKTGWTWLDWAVAVMSLLGFAGMIVLIFIKANKSQVVKVESDQADMAKEMKQIEIDDNLESTLEATPVGIAQEIFVTIAGERGLLRFTKSGKGMVTTDQIDTQTQAMKIATLRSTLKRHIGAGRVHTFPYVQEAAA